MSNGGGSIKKRLCNPPAEQIASHGDHEIAGLFMGAGKAIEALEKYKGYGNSLSRFTDAIIEIEQDYVKARKQLATEYVERCHEAYDRLLRDIGYEGPGGY